MMSKRYLGMLVLALFSIGVFAQKAERDYIRKGNRLFKDSIFVDAEVNYRKAIDVNPKSSVAMYNLANTLLAQNKVEDAMKQYVATANIEKDKHALSQIYHNMGVIFHTQKDYAKAVEAYKESLRRNPQDDETRYNLALAQKQLKDQQQQNQNQNQDQKQQKKEEQKDQNKQNQQNKDQNKEQDNQQQQQQNQQQKEDNMSKENAEQLLRSVMQDEKKVQNKLKKQQVIQGGRLEKDW